MAVGRRGKYEVVNVRTFVYADEWEAQLREELLSMKEGEHFNKIELFFV